MKFVDWTALGKQVSSFTLDGYYQMGTPLSEIKCLHFARQDASDDGRAYIRRTDAKAAADRSQFDGSIDVNRISTCF